jgi:hypothetical protein
VCLDDDDWLDALAIERTIPWRTDTAATVRMMHADAGLYLSVDVADAHLWADGTGTGAGNRWEVETDDSITFYFDPDKSRDEYFADADRAFGVNISNPDDPINAANGAVRRWKYVKGTGAGGAPDVVPGGAPAEGTLWATTTRGTVNDDTDTDGGWTVEIFLPWEALNMSAPAHAQTIGINFDLIFDDDGADRNFTDNRAGDDRFDLPPFVDDHLQGAHSSYSDSQAGVRGPVNYAEAMFVAADSTDAPPRITDLSADGVSAYGARLAFTAPAANGSGDGHVSAYEIRYFSGVVTDATWTSATVYEQAYVPRLAGLPESLRIAGLEPDTEYTIALRAVDANGNASVISNTSTITTDAATPGDMGRIIPAPAGAGLVYENLDPFTIVGEHLGLSWGYFRNLYPGDVWDPNSQSLINYNDNPSFEGEAGPHFDDLADAGVNTLRVFLEVLNTDQTGNRSVPDGRYWIEHPAGVFNDDMRQFVLNALEEAAARDMYLVFSPFDTFNWDEVFETVTPWHTSNRGPLSDIDDFFQNGQTLAMAKARIREVMTWVQASPHAAHLLGWESLNEWDSTEWTRNAEGDADPGRETEMRRRARWMHELNTYIRAQDPDRLVFSSTTALGPRGPLARALFYDRSIDVLAPHYYTNAGEEPINNPDDAKHIRPADDNARLTAYWRTHRNDHAPLINGEWGMTRADWPNSNPHYSPDFSQADDEAMYRTVIWSGIAAGQAGTSLRITTSELESNLNSLSDGMRDVQRAVAAFNAYGSAFDDASFLPRTLAGRIEVESELPLLAWGTADDTQGIIYILQDERESTATVTDALLTIDGLTTGDIHTVEFWLTSGSAAAPSLVLTGERVHAGRLTIELPDIASGDLVLRFARTSHAQPDPLSSFPDGAVRAATLDDGTLLATALSDTVRPLALRGPSLHSNWSAASVASGDFTPTDTTDIVVDPKDDSFFVAAPNPAGLMLFHQQGDGSWSPTNLTSLVGGGATPIVSGLTHYVSPDLSRDFDGNLVLDDKGDPVYPLAERDRNNIHIAGLNSAGELVLYYQKRDADNADTYWAFKNITTEDLIPDSQPIPEWVGELVGYATPWNGQNIAGIDANGEITAVWTAPDRNGVWAATNLSQLYSTPRLEGGLSVYVNWGINITGVLPDGSLGVTWWSAQLENERRDDGRTDYWAFTNLTESAPGPTVHPDLITNYTTPNWPGNNIVALTTDNELVVFWWTPTNADNFGREWLVDNLTSALPSAELPASGIAGVAGRDGASHILAVADDGAIIHYAWSEVTGWVYTNVTDTADAWTA